MEGASVDNYSVKPRSGIDHWALFLPFVGIGLGFLFFSRLLIAPRDFFSGFLQIFIASWLFVMAAFLIDWLITKKTADVYHQFILVYFILGFLGLFFIEWLMMGNSEILGWPYLFSLWAGGAVMPKLLLCPVRRESFAWSIGVWIMAIFGIFICVGGLMYFLLPDYGRSVWMLMMMGMTEAFNIVYWREFYLAGREQERLALAVKP